MSGSASPAAALSPSSAGIIRSCGRCARRAGAGPTLGRPQRVCLDGRPHLGVLQMGIDLGSAHIAVPQQFLEGENIDVPGLIHQGGGGVAQFMGGNPFRPAAFMAPVMSCSTRRLEIRSLRRLVIKTAGSLGDRPSTQPRFCR